MQRTIDVPIDDAKQDLAGFRLHHRSLQSVAWASSGASWCDADQRIQDIPPQARLGQ